MYKQTLSLTLKKSKTEMTASQENKIKTHNSRLKYECFLIKTRQNIVPMQTRPNISKLDLREGGSSIKAIHSHSGEFSTFYRFLYSCLSFCRFIKGNINAENMHTVLSVYMSKLKSIPRSYFNILCFDQFLSLTVLHVYSHEPYLIQLIL